MGVLSHYGMEDMHWASTSRFSTTFLSTDTVLWRISHGLIVSVMKTIERIQLLSQAHILQCLLSSVKHQDRIGDPGSFLCCSWKPGAGQMWLKGSHWTYGFGDGTFTKTAMRSLIKWASWAECGMMLLRSGMLASSLLFSFVDVFQIGVRL